MKSLLSSPDAVPIAVFPALTLAGSPAFALDNWINPASGLWTEMA